MCAAPSSGKPKAAKSANIDFAGGAIGASARPENMEGMKVASPKVKLNDAGSASTPTRRDAKPTDFTSVDVSGVAVEVGTPEDAPPPPIADPPGDDAADPPPPASADE